MTALIARPEKEDRRGTEDETDGAAGWKTRKRWLVAQLGRADAGRLGQAVLTASWYEAEQGRGSQDGGRDRDAPW